MDEQFVRTEALVGKQAMMRLAQSRVAVFGIGGVGGYAIEALVRSGIGALDIIDKDTIDPSNLNRQIIATHDTIGKDKTQAMKERIESINPECLVTTHNCFFLPETASSFDFSRYDYVIDAVDTVTAKLQIIEQAKKAGVSVISSMGTGNKLDPTAFEVTDISKTSVCPLAKIIRKELRKRGIRNVKVVYSKEQPRTPAISLCSDNRRSTPASIAFVPSVAGLIIASEVIKDIACIS